MRYALSLAALLAAVSGLSLPASAAEDTSATSPAPPAVTAPGEKQPELIPEEKAEKVARKAC
jgi:hypothetical protein